MTGRPIRAALPAVTATVAMSVFLAGVVVGTLALLTPYRDSFIDPSTGGWNPARVLRLWGIASLVALPLGFVFGVPLLAVVRSLMRRGDRRDR